MKTRKTLKASFVVTFAGTASMAVTATGCFSDATVNPPMPSCPAELPAYGAECDVEEYSDSCVFESVDECGNDVTATCADGAWELSYEGTCNPPMVTCPEILPTTDDACDGVGSCEYDDECGSVITATCTGSVWDVESQGTVCNPPAPCEFNETAADCGANPSCRWLTPGCPEGGVEALPKAGCYPAEPCADDAGCAPELTCQEVEVLPPCEGDGCACSAPTTVCL